MSRAYLFAGYDPAGPRRIRCRLCGAVISSNALARSGHERGKRHQAAIDQRHAYEQRRRRAALERQG